jgi:hypothetical protein
MFALCPEPVAFSATESPSLRETALRSAPRRWARSVRSVESSSSISAGCPAASVTIPSSAACPSASGSWATTSFVGGRRGDDPPGERGLQLAPGDRLHQMVVHA